MLFDWGRKGTTVSHFSQLNPYFFQKKTKIIFSKKTAHLTCAAFGKFSFYFTQENGYLFFKKAVSQSLKPIVKIRLF